MAEDIIVRVRAEGVDKLVKSLKDAGIEFEKTGKKAKKTENVIDQGFKKIGKTIGTVFATQQLIKFTKELARTAVEIDATNKKLQIVFGDSSKAVDDFARRSATSLGLTVNEYKKAAAAAGDLLIPIGFQRDQAAKLSNDLVKLSGALSAWTGGQLNASQVSEILTKALLGEREQLKQLGIQISEADIKSKLLEKGQAKLTGTALAQAKALASLELITAKSADAQAAFADDTKTLAESQLELTANIRQFKDDIAEKLIPALANWSSKILDIIKQYKLLRQLRAGTLDTLSELEGLSIDQLNKKKQFYEDEVKALKETQAELRKNASIFANNQKAFAQTSNQLKEYELRLLGVNAAIEAQNIKDDELIKSIKIYRDLVREQIGNVELNTKVLEILEGRKRAIDAANNANSGSTDNLTKETKKQKDEVILLNKVWDEFNTNLLSVASQTVSTEELITALGLAAAGVAVDFEKLGNITFGESLPELITQAGIEAAFKTVFTNISKDRLDINKKTSEELLAEEERLRIEQVEKDKEAQEQIRDERINKANEGINIASNTANDILALQQQAIQTELQALEDKNKRGEISDKEYQEKKAELQNKAARTQRAADITNAIVGTALGITQGLASPFPLNILLPVIAATTGAAQIALIASQPVPQFAKGTKGKKKAPAGFKWVGEEGPELLFDGGGYDVLTAGDSEQLSNILASYSIPVQFTRTEDELNKPIKSIKDITSNNAFSKIDWNPLLNASDMQRRSLGKKLDVIHYDLMRVNYGLTRRKTAN